ncbi:uncharacterized protein LOC142167094 [Nicotiana tabacum]|uniref:Uncharacterized protein LOC142167094 n=1 Tax=Nicotiana tabacum TaxID=4097 RepID=A0AC58SEF6_TOBAC
MIKKGARPIKQAQRRFRLEFIPSIEAEVNKLIEAGFIREVKYPTWISSIVPVKKKNGQIRVCVNFRDLNNACPKDEFPLPIPELMIDSTTGYEAMSFMDGSSGYNQIRMTPKDEELTAFHTPKGIYCYKVIPFGLKNVGAIYQRAMQNIFDDILHKNVECYMDDLVVKSRKGGDHLQDLRMVFKRLQRYQLRMNPLKCAFGVTSEKFLGFIVRHRGIEIDQAKVDAILKMPEPRNKLIGWLDNVTLQHVPRKENKKVDALAALASTLTLPGQTQITICQKWIVPPDENEDEESKLERLVAVAEAEKKIQGERPKFVGVPLASFTTRTSFEGVLLRCLGEDEATQALQEANSGVYGSHQSGPKLHFHIKRMGYYWPTMVKDCLDYARRCKACQFHANFIHQPPEILYPTVASWPFDAWGLDVVGPLPNSSGGHLYILATNDYFSKWAEAVTLKDTILVTHCPRRSY